MLNMADGHWAVVNVKYDSTGMYWNCLS